MHAIFIAWGNGAPNGRKLDKANAVDIAPTIAKLLQVKLENVEGKPLFEPSTLRCQHTLTPSEPG